MCDGILPKVSALSDARAQNQDAGERQSGRNQFEMAEKLLDIGIRLAGKCNSLDQLNQHLSY